MRDHRVRALQLRERRRRLVLRSAAQRAELGEAWSALAPPLRLLDGATRVLCQLRARPWLLALPAFAWALLGPRRTGRLAALVPVLVRLWSAAAARDTLLRGPR